MEAVPSLAPGLLTKGEAAAVAEFVRLVRPGSPGWNRIRRRHGIQAQPFLGRALLLWGVAMVCLFSLNFGIGSLLLLRPVTGAVLLSAAALAGLALWRLVKRG